MPASLRPPVYRELTARRAARHRGDRAATWRALERAHILSQPSAWLHTRVHLAMLAQAVRVRDPRELFGQLVRVAVAAVGSWLGRYPVGNDGRARTPIAQPAPLPADLEAELRSSRSRSR